MKRSVQGPILARFQFLRHGGGFFGSFTDDRVLQTLNVGPEDTETYSKTFQVGTVISFPDGTKAEISEIETTIYNEMNDSRYGFNAYQWGQKDTDWNIDVKIYCKEV